MSTPIENNTSKLINLKEKVSSLPDKIYDYSESVKELLERTVKDFTVPEGTKK